MDVTEISGFKTGVDNSGVNFLDPADAFEILRNGYIYRQEILSRKGFKLFGNRCSDGTRVMGIFENILPDSSRELLVCTKQFLYKYDPSSNTFLQIPFNARILALDINFNFNISDSAHYVSGTTYFTASGLQRFVFTGEGMEVAPLTPGKDQSGVFFYNGTDIGDFFCTDDNPNAQEPASGSVTRAKQLVWFGERLNLIHPYIDNIPEPQAVLYSGIRNTAGNGDKFNVAGSGQISADTYESLLGCNFLGDVLILHFQRSNWALEKTRDAFNPYFVRKIPSVLGTSAGFSTVSWNYEVKSAGNTGFISTDGRQSLRFDNKIPYFASDQISASDFDLTYGGFDRINGQFLFSFLSNDSSASTQDKVLVYNYEESTFSVNDQRFSVFGQTIVGQSLTWNDIDETQNPAWGRWDTTEELWNKIGVGNQSQKTLAGDDLGFVYEINADYDDYQVAISNITQADEAVLSVSASAFQAGDRVVIEGITSGMTEINDIICDVLSATTTSITININSSLFTAYTGGGVLSKVIDFEGILRPFNPYRDKGRRCYLSHIDFLVNTPSGTIDVSIISDEEQSPFKTAQIIPTVETTKARQWITMSVNEEANFFSIDISREAYNQQSVITAIRLYSLPGGYNSG